MNTMDNNQGVDAVPTNDAGEESKADNQITLSREEYDKMTETLGSLKRENKQLKKPVEKPYQETPTKETKSDDQTSKIAERVERMALRSAQITHEDDIELARNTAKKWNMDIEDLVDDPDFQAKLERQQSERSNRDATSNVKGNAGGSSPKNTAEYWMAKGQPPTPDQVPDRKTRAKITRDMMKQAKGGGKQFYND